MGEPTEMVIAGRLVRFCCASCEPKVRANPLPYIEKIDAAWAAAGKFAPDGHDEHSGHDHDMEHDG